MQNRKKFLANLPKFRKENEELKIKFKELLKLLPNTKEIPSLLTNISNLAQDCGLEILLFKPQKEIPRGFYADIPVEMQVNGDYHNIGHFFDKVSKLERIVNIADISIAVSSKKGNDADKPKLNSKFKAITFKFIEKEVKSVKKKKKKKKVRPVNKFRIVSFLNILTLTMLFALQCILLPACGSEESQTDKKYKIVGKKEGG